jgi:hypothetical protein
VYSIHKRVFTIGLSPSWRINSPVLHKQPILQTHLSNTILGPLPTTEAHSWWSFVRLTVTRLWGLCIAFSVIDCCVLDTTVQFLVKVTKRLNFSHSSIICLQNHFFLHVGCGTILFVHLSQSFAKSLIGHFVVICLWLLAQLWLLTHFGHFQLIKVEIRGGQLKIWWKLLCEWNDLIGCGHFRFILEQIFLQIKILCWREIFWNLYLREQQKKCSSRSSLCTFFWHSILSWHQHAILVCFFIRDGEMSHRGLTIMSDVFRKTVKIFNIMSEIPYLPVTR